MKIMVIVLLFLLTSCSRNVEVSFEIEDEYLVYAINEKTNQIEQVNTIYEVTCEESLFLLYTIFQNYLPIGYKSPANPNIELISTKIKDKEIFYEVNQFINLVDIEKFSLVLNKTAKHYGYGLTHLVFNNCQLS